MLPADLLDAVDREGVLDVPVALVLAGQVAGVAALDEHRDDLVVGDGVLDALVGHLVELGLDVPDQRHVLDPDPPVVATPRPSFFVSYRDAEGITAREWTPVLAKLVPAGPEWQFVMALPGRADLDTSGKADWRILPNLIQRLRRRPSSARLRA